VGLPPNLEVLTFVNEVGEDEELEELLAYTLENRGLFARKLKELVVVGGEGNGKDYVSEKVVEACGSDVRIRVRPR
jgi:hypothetical protein